MSAASPEPSGSARASLLDSLAVILPDLPPGLVEPEAVPRLVSVARALPPLHSAGFECRLAADEATVDLQQGINNTREEPARLAQFLAAAGALNEPWTCVKRLAQRWSTPGDIVQRGVNEVWLELDSSPHAPGPLTLADSRPSVFAVLERAGDEALPLACELLALLAPQEDPVKLGSTLMRLVRASPPSARLTHIGVMLGRADPALRVHLSPVSAREIGEYLTRVGWGADPSDVLEAATVLLEYGDWVVLCLDVLGDQVLRIGLECFFSQKHGLDPRWRPLLKRLSDLGLSSAAKADALLGWPGTLTPLNSPAPWPEDLIAQSLLEPQDTFSMLDRRLSHVKLTVEPGRALSAKAYFWYVPIWADQSRR